MNPEPGGSVVRWDSLDRKDDPEWEDAYQRFETPDEERKKFRDRLRSFGSDQWDRQARILELFCGRGGGLKALESMGFVNLEGVDSSIRLLERCSAQAQLYDGDCRCLRMEDASRDIVVIQGGLHHLPDLERDLPKVLDEVLRVLVSGGIVCVTEPHSTPYLRYAHWACRSAVLRRLWPKLDALAEMVRLEGETYLQWLRGSDFVLSALTSRFEPLLLTLSSGKLWFKGLKGVRQASSLPKDPCMQDARSALGLSATETSPKSPYAIE